MVQKGGSIATLQASPNRLTLERAISTMLGSKGFPALFSGPMLTAGVSEGLSFLAAHSGGPWKWYRHVLSLWGRAALPKDVLNIYDALAPQCLLHCTVLHAWILLPPANS